jgi:hypothetical protein
MDGIRDEGAGDNRMTCCARAFVSDDRIETCAPTRGFRERTVQILHPPTKRKREKRYDSK